MLKRNYIGFRIEQPLYDKLALVSRLYDEPISEVVRNIIKNSINSVYGETINAQEVKEDAK